MLYDLLYTRSRSTSYPLAVGGVESIESRVHSPYHIAYEDGCNAKTIMHMVISNFNE